MASFDVFISEVFKLPLAQLPKVVFHASLIAVIISSFWILDSIKDPILNITIGIESQPLAKLLSVFTTLLSVCVYDFLTSRVSKVYLIIIISSFFGSIFFLLSALLSHPQIGLANHTQSGFRWIGWLSYLMIESYGSLMIAVFWSFTNTVMDVSLAKASYGLIIGTAQIGALLGSSIAANSKTIGIPSLFLIGACLTLSINLLMKLYSLCFHLEAKAANEPVHAKAALPIKGTSSERSTVFQSSLKSCYEGCFLIYRYKYVMHLLVITLLYEILLTLIDYKFKVMGAKNFLSSNENNDAEDSFVLLLARFGQFSNLLSFLLSFFFFSFLVSNYGIRKCLMILPMLLIAGTTLTAMFPELWLIFLTVSILKALVFGFFDPLKEILYVPTSDAIKFKAASWIEVFGARFAKALGSLLNQFLQRNVYQRNYSLLLLSLALGAALLYLVWNVGRMFDDLIADDRVVGTNTSAPYNLDFYAGLETRGGIAPGEIGYDGYDLHVFDGVFAEGGSDISHKSNASVGPSNT